MRRAAFLSQTDNPYIKSLLVLKPAPEIVGPNPTQKSKKRKKGEQDSSPEPGDQCARKRAQVRSAQQAYRNHEKATIASLREDVDVLKTRLLGMGGILDEMIEMALSLPNLLDKTKDVTKILHIKVEQYRLHVDMQASTRETPKKVNLSQKNDTCDIISHLLTATSEALSAESLSSSCLDNHNNDTEFWLSKAQPSRLFDIYPSIPTPQSRFGQPIGHVGDSIKFSLEFSLQLKHEALRAAYNLVKKSETPYYILCQKFRYCIFSSTRDEVSHLEFLIHESAKRVPDTKLTSTVVGTNTSYRTFPFS
ncbi:hypothetical protein B7494_g1921 [Chlorociboria aeruginascens]|nr:hypothetical protein B7494_g1921 [Chlorociboria aeruginascens]